MSTEVKKTVAFVAVALALMGAAFINVTDRRRDVEFAEQGKKFFPDFDDPRACASLEVIAIDPATAVADAFKVQFADGKWTIPSREGYPADGKDRLAKTAAGVIDLTKDSLRSDRLEDQETLGVIDPLDAKAIGIKGRGKRITLKDSADKVLADLIIGDEVKGSADAKGGGGDESKGRSSQRYVRVPGQRFIYAVNLKLDLSTKFPDWIEANLLKIDTAKVRKVAFDSTKMEVLGGRGRLVKGEVLSIARNDASAPWTLTGLAVPEGKELDTAKLSTLTTALGDLKIVDVKRKPEGLSRDLMASGDIKELTSRAGFASLISRGFYPYEGGKVYSNQGDVVVSTEDGAVYTLRFGEADVVESVATAPDSASEAAKKDDARKDAAKPAEKAGGIDSRYLLVTIGFDPTLLPPLPDPDLGKPVEIPADVFHHEPGSPERVAAEKAAQEKLDKRKADEAKRVVDASAKVRELSDRFAAWYYLTPTEAFKSIALDRTTLIHDKSAKPAGGPGDGGFPGGMPGFPPAGLGGGRPPFNPHNPG